MVNCSKCGITVVQGDYVEIDDKSVCFACLEKEKEKKSITPKKGLMKNLSIKKPFSLKIIIFFVFLIAVSSLVLLQSYSKLINILGIMLFIGFFLVGIGLIFLLNKARIITILLMIASIIMDLSILMRTAMLFGVIVRITIAILIIISLQKSKIKDLFV